jgi:putative transposase
VRSVRASVWYRTAKQALKTAQRRVSRRKQGSNRRRKVVTRLAKAHLKMKRQRQDFHLKTALHLIKTNDRIYHKDVQTANMLKNHHLANSIADASWSQVLGILSFKAICDGCSVVAVDPAFTGQTCSGCGVLVQRGLSLALVTGLRNEPASGPECGEEQREGRAGPSASRGVGRVVEPREPEVKMSGLGS